MTISPAEYYYLTEKSYAEGGDLLKWTLKDLFLKDVIRIEPRWIFLHKREKRKRLRYFFCKGTNFSEYHTENKHESFILNAYNDGWDEFRYYEFRQYLKGELYLLGLRSYKINYVISDLRKKDLMNFFRRPNSKARRLVKKIKKTLDFIEDNIDNPGVKSEILKSASSLGNLVLHLNKETLKKIIENSNKAEIIDNFQFLETIGRSLHSLDSFFSVDDFSFADSFSSDSGFGGFGGGDFGGGGAGGSW